MPAKAKQGRETKPKAEAHRTGDEDEAIGLETESAANRAKRLRIIAQDRRATENNVLADLSSTLPLEQTVLEKQDKSSLLRLAATYLRLRHILDSDEDEALEESLPEPEESAQGDDLSPVTCGLAHVIPTSGYQRQTDWDVEDGSGSPPSTEFTPYPTFDTNAISHTAIANSNNTKGSQWPFGPGVQRDKNDGQANGGNLWSWSENFNIDGEDLNIRNGEDETATSPAASSLRTQSWGCGDSGLGGSSPDVSSPESIGHHSHLDFDRHLFPSQSKPKNQLSRPDERYQQQKQLSLSPRSAISSSYTLPKGESHPSLSTPYTDNDRRNGEYSQTLPKSQKSQDKSDAAFTEQLPDEGRLMLDAVNGFFLVLDGEGRVLYVSENIQEHLGHSQADMLGRDIRDYIYTNDVKELQRHLSGDEILRGSPGEVPSWMTRRTFYLGMKFSFPKSGTRSKDTGFSLVQWNAKLRYKKNTTSNKANVTREMENEDDATTQKKQKKEPSSKRRRTTANKKKSNSQSAEPNISESASVVAKLGNDGCGVDNECRTSRYVNAMVVLCRPVRTESVLEIRLDGNMFISRHDLGFHFIFCDPRVSMLIGYEPSDMLGRTAFQFHSPWDAIICKHCAKQLILSGTATSGYYRFLSRTGVWVWMATSATIVYDTRRRPQYIVCRNYLISPQIAQRDVSRQKKDFDMMKYSAFSLDTDLPLNSAQSSKAKPTVSYRFGAGNGIGIGNERSNIMTIDSSININNTSNKSSGWRSFSTVQETKSLVALRPRLGDIDPNVMLGNLFPTQQTTGQDTANLQTHPKQPAGQPSSINGINAYGDGHGVVNNRVNGNQSNVRVTDITDRGDASTSMGFEPLPVECQEDPMDYELQQRNSLGFYDDQTGGFSKTPWENQFGDHEQKLSSLVSSGRPDSPILTSLWHHGDKIPGFMSQPAGASNTFTSAVKILSPEENGITDMMSKRMTEQGEPTEDSVIMDTTTTVSRNEPMREDTSISHGDLFPTLGGPDFFTMFSDSLSTDFVNLQTLLDTPQSIPLSSTTSFSDGQSVLYGEIRDREDNNSNEAIRTNTLPNSYECERMDTPICFESPSPARCNDQSQVDIFQASSRTAPSTPTLTDNNQLSASKQQRLRSLLSGELTGSRLEPDKKVTSLSSDVSMQSKIPGKATTFVSNKSEKISILKNTLIGNGQPPKIPHSIPVLTKPVKFVPNDSASLKSRRLEVSDKSQAGLRSGSTVINGHSPGKRTYPYKIISTAESCEQTLSQSNQQFSLVGQIFSMSNGRMSHDNTNTINSESDETHDDYSIPDSASPIELMSVDSGSSSSDESSSARHSLLRTLLDKEGAVIQGPPTFTEYMLQKALEKKDGSNKVSMRHSESVSRESSIDRGGFGRTVVKRSRYRKMNPRKTVELPLPKLSHGSMIKYGKDTGQNRKPTKELPLPCVNASLADQISQSEMNKNATTRDAVDASSNSINDVSLPDDLLDFAVEYCGSLGTDQTEALLSDISESSLLDDNFDSFVDSPAQTKLNELPLNGFELNTDSQRVSSSTFSLDPPLSQASLSHNTNIGIFQRNCLPEIDKSRSISTETYSNSALGVPKVPSNSSTQIGRPSTSKEDNAGLKLPNIAQPSSYGAMNGKSLLRTAMTIPDVDTLIEQIPLANRYRKNQNQTTSTFTEASLHSEMSEPDVVITKVIGMKEVIGAETSRRSNHGRLFKFPITSPGTHSTERVLNSSPLPVPSPGSSEFSLEHNRSAARVSHSTSPSFSLSPSPSSLHRTCQSGSQYRKPFPASPGASVSYLISPRSLPSPAQQECAKNTAISTGTEHSRISSCTRQSPATTTTPTNSRSRSSSATSVFADGVNAGSSPKPEVHSTSEPVSVMVMRKESHRSRRFKSIAVQTDNAPGEVYPEFDRGPTDVILFPSSYYSQSSRSSRQMGLQQSSPRHIASSPSSSSTTSTPSHSPPNMSQLERFLRECPSREDSPDNLSVGVSSVEAGSPSSRSGANTPFLQRLLTGELSKDNYRRLDEQLREHERRLSMSSGSDEG